MLIYKPIYKTQTIRFLVEKLLKTSLFRVAAIIFIISIVLLITTAIAGSVNNSTAINGEDEAVRRESFIYASEYLNSIEIIIEQSYVDDGFFDAPNIVLGDSAFVAANSPSEVSLYSVTSRGGIITYKVQKGDVPSEIAAAFGITTNTLLWANNLNYWDRIKPNQELIILPVSGVKHTVKKGETLDKIVKTYKGDMDTTIEINALPADGKLAIGQDIIIPDGQKPVQYVPRTYASYTAAELGPYGDTSHRFPWGQCTWYVAQKRYIPWNGDAKTWLIKAPQYGFGTGSEPRIGSIVVTRESIYGHVAYVEATNENTITVSEMSLGRGIKRVRVLNQDDWRIRGYIY